MFGFVRSGFDTSIAEHRRRRTGTPASHWEYLVRFLVWYPSKAGAFKLFSAMDAFEILVKLTGPFHKTFYALQSMKYVYTECFTTLGHNCRR